jgi:hypothetical protein
MENRVVDFTNRMRSSQGIPFSKYSINFGAWSHLLDFDFFQICGQAIRCFSSKEAAKMGFYAWDIKEIGTIRHILFELTPQLAELFLYLNLRRITRQQIGHGPPSAIPNLKSLHVKILGLDEA